MRPEHSDPNGTPLLPESPTGDIQTVDMALGIVAYVSPYRIHPSINAGDRPLVISLCFPADAGQGYGLIGHLNGMKVRVVADEG